MRVPMLGKTLLGCYENVGACIAVRIVSTAETFGWFHRNANSFIIALHTTTILNKRRILYEMW
jgi:hypothetical protein